MIEDDRIPPYLKPMLDGTPLAVEIIKEAWPGLAMSDRAWLLSVLLAEQQKEPLALKYQLFRDRLIDLALADENGYVRYLAAKHVRKPNNADDEESKSRYLKIKQDKAGIVQSAEYEDDFHFFRAKPEDFWKYPQSRRLALVCSDDNGEYIAKLLRYASTELLLTEAIPLHQAAEVLFQFLANFAKTFPESKDWASKSHEGLDMYCLSQSVTALWAAIPEIAKPLTYVLLDWLPEPPYSPIPTAVLASLDDGQLVHLLRRSDLALKELRRKIYLESETKQLREAAVNSWMFDLQDSDLSKLSLGPNDSEEVAQKKMNELTMLLGLCAGATLVQRQAICDLMTDPRYPEKVARHIDSCLSDAPHFQTARAKRLSSTALENEVLELRLYSLALRISQSNNRDEPEDLPAEFKSFKQQIVMHNPWETYLNLRKAASLEQWKHRKTDLPTVVLDGVDLPD